METKARYRVIGLFMLIGIGIGFVFVYWLQNASALSERETFRIRFTDTVGGLQVGAPVMFDGLRVGEVTGVSLDANDPHVITVTIGINKATPLRSDTSIKIDYQGLMGSAALVLNGGSATLPKLSGTTQSPELVAKPDAAQGLSDMGRQVLAKLDSLFDKNSGDIHETIANLKVFSASLSKNSDKIDTILGGLEKTFSASKKPAVATFDLTAPGGFPPLTFTPQAQLVVANLRTISTFDTPRLIVKSQNGQTQPLENAQWSDDAPKLIQEKLLQTFENAHYLDFVSPQLDQDTGGDYQLLIDLRAFDFTEESNRAEIEFSARILSKDGKVMAAHLFRSEAAGTTASDPASVAKAMDEAFGKAARDVVAWAATAVFDTAKSKNKAGLDRSE